LSAICGWEDSGIKPYSLQNPAVSTNHPLLDELAIRLTHWRNCRSGKQRYQGSVRAGFRGREQNLYCVSNATIESALAAFSLSDEHGSWAAALSPH
jgi:hypothetical protein